MFQDLRYGMRMLAKSPNYTLIAIITLALGIGANTAIFSIVKSVLIRPLPFARPDRLMQARYLQQSGIPQGDHLSWIARRDLVDWRTRSRSFERIGGYWYDSFILPGEGTPEFIRGASVTQDLLPMLGIQPALGRYFLPEKGKPGGDRLIILSDELWRRRFGADPGIIGQTVRAIDRTYIVVGVMPPGFNFPLRQQREVVRFPLQMGFWTLSDDDLSKEGRDRQYNAILQLKPGVGAGQAQAELETLFAQSVRDNPQGRDKTMIGVRLVSLKDQTVGGAATTLPILLGAVGLVVLMDGAGVETCAHWFRSRDYRRAGSQPHAVEFVVRRDSYRSGNHCHCRLIAFVRGDAGLFSARATGDKGRSDGRASLRMMATPHFPQAH